MSDQIYIDTIKAEIYGGRYEHLFRIGGTGWTDSVARKDLVFLDIGANVGLVSIYAVPYCKRIVAVEPCKSTFETLQYNTGRYSNIERMNVALTPKDGPHEFFVNDINFTASSTVNTYGQRIMVEGRTLTSIRSEMGLNHVDVCKIDAEGAEGESLWLGEIYNNRNVIQTFYVETHNCPKTTWEHKLGTLVGNFARCGYTRMRIDGMAITAEKP